MLNWQNLQYEQARHCTVGEKTPPPSHFHPKDGQWMMGRWLCTTHMEFDWFYLRLPLSEHIEP